MSLSVLETAVNEYIGQILVDECARPEPDRVLRYHGEPPNLCCSQDGMLATWWENLYTSASFPNNTTTATPCQGPVTTVIATKYVVCWPKLNVSSQGGITLPDAEHDATAAMLADVGECVMRALLALTCDPERSDPFVAAVLAQTGKLLRFADCVPLAPRGLCAGVKWRLYAAVAVPLALS